MNKMNSFILKLNQTDIKKRVLQDESDTGFYKLSGSGMELKANRGPEISVFYLMNRSAVLVVWGFAVFDGKNCAHYDAAEAFLSAWSMDRKAALEQLDGAFLIFIFDVESREACVITDPNGTRPAWVAEGDAGLIISCSPLHAAQYAGIDIRPDPAWLWSMLHYKRAIGGRSSIEGVGGIPAGSLFSWSNGRSETTNWYDYSFAVDRSKSSSDYGNEFLRLIKKTVSSICSESENPVLLLSGGLDSRLLAATCPEQVHCLTLCDSENREVSVAKRIAETLHLSHDVLSRDKNWYPGLLEDSCEMGGGVWLWDQAHFLPLGQREFKYDTTLLGYGSDLFFKGNDLKDDKLWLHERLSPDQMISNAMTLLRTASPKIKTGAGLLDPDFAKVCRHEFEGECWKILESSVQYCSCLPDLWQLFWNGNLTRAAGFMNVLCLRGFTRERTVFSTKMMRRFYQTLPPQLRRSGQLPLMALRAGGYRNLLSIQDANTWLPYTLPPLFHHTAMSARRTIAGIKKKRRIKSQSADFASRCSWPHNGRFWFSSESMAELMAGLIDGPVFEGAGFDEDVIKQCWEDHLNGVADRSNELDLLVTFGVVFS